jgi:hypothetical protein
MAFIIVSLQYFVNTRFCIVLFEGGVRQCQALFSQAVLFDQAAVVGCQHLMGVNGVVLSVACGLTVSVPA